MKGFLLCAVLLLGTSAFALPGADNRSTVAKSDVTSSALFVGSYTCEGEGDIWAGATTCPGQVDPCWKWIKRGRNAGNNDACCTWTDVCSVASVEQESIESKNLNISNVFSPDQTEAYWGYVGSTSRSPNNGRTTSISARLDICIGSTDVDSAVANGLSWCMISGTTHSTCNQL